MHLIRKLKKKCLLDFANTPGLPGAPGAPEILPPAPEWSSLLLLSIIYKSYINEWSIETTNGTIKKNSHSQNGRLKLLNTDV